MVLLAAGTRLGAGTRPQNGWLDGSFKSHGSIVFVSYEFNYILSIFYVGDDDAFCLDWYRLINVYDCIYIYIMIYRYIVSAYFPNTTQDVWMNESMSWLLSGIWGTSTFPDPLTVKVCGSSCSACSTGSVATRPWQISLWMYVEKACSSCLGPGLISLLEKDPSLRGVLGWVGVF